MKKEHTVVTLFTEKAKLNSICEGGVGRKLFLMSSINIRDYNEKYFFREKDSQNLQWIPQHLYILSDEEIKEGEWVLNTFHSNEGLIKVGIDSTLNYIKNREQYKKIIATTNPDLWKGQLIGEIQGIEQYADGIPKIGLDFVKRFVKEWNKGNKIEKVMLQYGEGELYTDASGYTESESFITGQNVLKLRSNGSVIISPAEERKYSKRDINMAIREAIMYPEKFMTGIVHDDKKSYEWIEGELKLIYK